MRTNNLLAAVVAVVAVFAEGCAAQIDETTPAPENIAETNQPYEDIAMPNPMGNPNMLRIGTYACQIGPLDTLTFEALTNVPYVRHDVTLRDGVKLSALPPIAELEECR